ncbi:MAG: hypothetical protein EA424_11435 [Planctomycetaceae bacterium]|nr:MAG: hypothetical protein EA424_11435 [Planctomycetaceae bacterium]
MDDKIEERMVSHQFIPPSDLPLNVFLVASALASVESATKKKKASDAAKSLHYSDAMGRTTTPGTKSQKVFLRTSVRPFF